MATYTRTLLSGSTSGQPIVVASSSDPGTTAHTAVTAATSFDEVYLYACNVSSADVLLNVQLGASGIGSRILATVSAWNTVTVLNGTPLNGTSRISAWCATTSAVNLFGWVNRIS